jgi:hypothetical protein
MATLLDAGILAYFGPVFVILFLFIIIYGILEYIKPFGASKMGLHAILALAVSLVFMMSGLSVNVVKSMVPWFLVAIIFLFFVIIMIRMFNVGEGDLRAIISNTSVYPWIVIFAIIVLLASLFSAFGQTVLEKGTGTNGGGTTNYTAGGTAGGGSGGSSVLIPDTPGTRSTTTSSFSTNLMNTLRNPRVLGMVFIFLVGAFAMFFLTKAATP